MGSMLRTLRHGFLKEALDFAGVHRERLAEVCRHSFALMMAILRHASRHEIFTNEITASIDHLRTGEPLENLLLPRQFQKHLDFPASDWSQNILWPIKVCAWNSNLSGTCGFRRLSRSTCKLCNGYASHGLLMDSKNDNQCMKKRFFFSSTIMHD